MPLADVHAARGHPGDDEPETGGVIWPLGKEMTGARERRYCRSCGFQLGHGERVVSFRYRWPSEDELWYDHWALEQLALHEADCRHGAAHDLVQTGRSFRTRWAELDEADAVLFGMHADGMSPARIASMIGTTEPSIARVLRRIAKQLRVASDRHARALAVDLLASRPARDDQTIDDELDDFIRDVTE